MEGTVITDEQRQPRPRLRSMIESWEREGVIRPEIATQALSSEPCRAEPALKPLAALRRREMFGYLGAAPVASAGLLLATSHVDLASLLLIGLLIAVASPVAIRASTRHTTNAPTRRRAPRHRSDRPANRDQFGNKRPSKWFKGRFEARGHLTTLASVNRR